MQKKNTTSVVLLVIGALLIIGAFVCMVAWVVLSLAYDPQEMYRHFPQDAGKRLAEINVMRTLALIGTFLLGAGGVGLGALGLYQMRATSNLRQRDSSYPL